MKKKKKNTKTTKKATKQLNTYALLDYMAKTLGIGRSGRCLLLYIINRLAKAQTHGKSVITFRRADLRTAHEIADIKEQAMYEGLYALRKAKIPGIRFAKDPFKHLYKAKIIDVK